MEFSSKEIRITPIVDLEELAQAITRHYESEQTIEQSRNIINNGFVFGYRCQEGDALGFCYILNSNGIYILDACNKGLKMFLALSVVKKVIKEAFEKITDCVTCVYKKDDIGSSIIRKRLGFKYLLTIQDKSLFFLQRS